MSDPDRPRRAGVCVRLLAAALWWAAAPTAAADTVLFETGGAAPVALDVPTFTAQLRDSGADVLFLGEIHDNPGHHRIQAEIVAALDAAGAVAVLTFEMIEPAEEAAVNAVRGWPGASAARGPGARGAETADEPAAQDAAQDAAAMESAIADAVGWAQSGWPDWSMYAPIFRAAPAAYVSGGETPRAALRPFMQGDAVEALAARPDAARFGLDRPLDPAEQAARETGQIAAHCDAIPREAAVAMVAAQRLRDAALAEAVLRGRAAATAAGRDGIVVVITGAGHARRDWGAPRMLARAAPALQVVSVGLIEAETEAAASPSSPQAAPFDAVAFAPPPDPPRPDPCAAFRARSTAP